MNSIMLIFFATTSEQLDPEVPSVKVVRIILKADGIPFYELNVVDRVLPTNKNHRHLQLLLHQIAHSLAAFVLVEPE